MDETDVILSSLLLVNSRTPYRELADKLNLSANAVHKRIQSLIDLGVIRKFTTKISLQALQAVIVILTEGLRQNQWATFRRSWANTALFGG